ncbi:MAG TPA: hypothetical protein VK988_11480 [Acidimicrobiales bacterium]|nr:hypothetical protein [Acidimicrobiales bacterium]
MLLPAAVHPESGYRYYDPSQVAEAEVVVAQFDLVAHDGKCRVRPVMIHRSIVVHHGAHGRPSPRGPQRRAPGLAGAHPSADPFPSSTMPSATP